MTTLKVIVTRNGADFLAGTVTLFAAGWRFVPRFHGGPSRRFWPTPQQAIGRRIRAYRLQTIDGETFAG